MSSSVRGRAPARINAGRAGMLIAGQSLGISPFAELNIMRVCCRVWSRA